MRLSSCALPVSEYLPRFSRILPHAACRDSGECRAPTGGFAKEATNFAGVNLVGISHVPIAEVEIVLYIGSMYSRYIRTNARCCHKLEAGSELSSTHIIMESGLGLKHHTSVGSSDTEAPLLTDRRSPCRCGTYRTNILRHG